MVAFFRSLGDTFEELRVEPDEFLESRDRVIVLGAHRGSANGAAFETPFAHVWGFQGGKAVHWKEYLDSSQMLSALGWRAPASVAAS
jgi:ketosteroid isomerase-like protein